MEFEIKGNPDFGEAVAQLESGDSFHAASGAMNWLRGPVSFKARLMGGLGKSLVRKVFGGTSMFVNEYKATGSSEVAFSHSLGFSRARCVVWCDVVVTAVYYRVVWAVLYCLQKLCMGMSFVLSL